MEHIKQYLISTYSLFPLKNVSGKTFYEFVELEFNTYLAGLNQIPSNEFERILESDLLYYKYFKPTYTKKRFLNCMKKVCKDYLSILQYCYKGDFFSAHQLFDSLLNTQRYGKYFGDIYINFLRLKLPKPDFYRMRDELKHDENGTEITIDNCWHIPFNLRNKAYIGRYSMDGYPCLYLADTPETCDAELGNLKDNKNRWVSMFDVQDIFLYDLRIPTNQNINDAVEFDIFQMLVCYPLILLCSCKKQNDGFNEEYYIPQLLFHHVIVNGNRGIRMGGIAYSSTQYKGGYNLAIPAIYDGMIPPSEGYSKILVAKLFPSKPTIYKKSCINK